MVFDLCESLEEILVDDENTHFKDIDGTLFNKDGKTLIKHPVSNGAVTLVIPEGVETVGDYALYDCDNLTSIVIPDTVVRIGANAMGLSDGIKELILPSSVEMIGSMALFGCKKLEYIVVGGNVRGFSVSVVSDCDRFSAIYYEGDAEGWNEICLGNFADYVDNEVIVYAYSENKPTEEGNYWHYVLGKVTVWD